MISFKNFIETGFYFISLEEARRNPEMNPKVKSYDAIKPYLNDPNVYISFTWEKKLGINPRSTYNTPNGIYCYPLVKSFEYYKIKTKVKDYGIFGQFPFASEAHWGWIFKGKPEKMLILTDSDYSEGDYEKDLEKIRVEYNKYNKSIFGNRFNKFVRSCENNNNNVKIRAAFIWNITRCAAGNWNPEARDVNPNKWNWFLRNILGYEGASDPEGKGIIHPSEKVQAVFFSKSNISILELIENKAENYKVDFAKLNDPNITEEEFIEIYKKNYERAGGDKGTLKDQSNGFLRRVTNREVLKKLFEWHNYGKLLNAWEKFIMPTRILDLYLDILTKEKLNLRYKPIAQTTIAKVFAKKILIVKNKTEKEMLMAKYKNYLPKEK